jgi:hypothetical protein
MMGAHICLFLANVGFLIMTACAVSAHGVRHPKQ